MSPQEQEGSSYPSHVEHASFFSQQEQHQPVRPSNVKARHAKPTQFVTNAGAQTVNSPFNAKVRTLRFGQNGK